MVPMVRSFRKALLMLLGVVICLSSEAAQPDTIRIVFIGDVMTHGPQVTAALRSGGDRNNPADYDYSDCFRHVADRFAAADFVVANMEFPCGVTPYSGYPQFSAPQSLAYEAKQAGVDLFLAANNHICDKGRTGIDSTYIVYSRMEIPFTGIYRSEGEEFIKNPLIVNIKGHEIAFINFTYGTNGLPVPDPWQVNLLDSAHVQKVIERAKVRGAELIIALPHWGLEYHLEPSESQLNWAGFLHRNGVAAIVGSHPHVVQPAVFAPPFATAYSLGNFISNQSDIFTQIGMLYELVLTSGDGGGLSIAAAVPTYTWCSRRRMLEANYTVIPILEWLGRRDEWSDKSDYDKMLREWTALKTKFNL